MGNFHRWTKAEESLLRKKYQTVGDKKLAELFNERFPKKVHTWTNKHIEKKRMHLGLKRTKKQEHDLRVQNNKDGRQLRMWEKRNKVQEGEIRTWNGRQFIRSNGKIVAYNRYLVNAQPGEVVRRIGAELKVITRAENARLNKQKSMDYPEELKEAIKTLNQLTKIINGKKDSRP